MDEPDDGVKSTSCVSPLDGVCPICRVGPGDLPSRWFFESRQRSSPSSKPSPERQPATPEGCLPGAFGFDAEAEEA
jgi:hypothetical protein